MKVRDVMTTPALTVGAETSYAELVHLLRENRIGSVPVIDAHGALLGVVTEDDLLYREAYGHDARSVRFPLGEITVTNHPAWAKVDAPTAAELMDRMHEVAALDEELDAIARRLLRTRRRSLPVVRRGRVVGVISRSDVLQRFDRPTRDLRRDVENTLAGWRFAHGGSQVRFTVQDGVVRLHGLADDGVDFDALRDCILSVDGVVSVEASFAANRT